MPYYNNPFGTPQQSFTGGMVPQQNMNAFTPQQTQSMDQQPETVFAWVQGRSGAEAYMLPPNKSAFLMDSNNSVLYAKGTDSYGRYSPLMSYKLVPMEETSYNQALPGAEAIDYDRIRSIISEEVSRQMDMIGSKPQKKESK